MDGGIWGLLVLARDHRGAVEYDLSTRFPSRCPRGLRSVGDTITLTELARLVAILRNDPSSAIVAALSGWEYPMSREALVLADLFDLTHSMAWAQGGGKGSRPKPYPRPFSSKAAGRQRGKPRPLAEMQARLREKFGRAPSI